MTAVQKRPGHKASTARPGLIPNPQDKDFATMRRVHTNIGYRNDIDLPLFTRGRLLACLRGIGREVLS
jgi:hypothetical protein